MSTYKIKKGRYYISPKDGKVEEVLPQDIKLDGISYKLHKELYKELDNKYMNLQDRLETSIFAIREYLSKKGIDTPNNDLKSLINDLYSVKTIIDGVEYLNFSLDDKGYINGVDVFNTKDNVLINDGIVDIPYDFDKGYYYIDNGVIVKDKEKEKEYWSVI